LTPSPACYTARRQVSRSTRSSPASSSTAPRCTRGRCRLGPRRGPLARQPFSGDGTDVRWPARTRARHLQPAPRRPVETRRGAIHCAERCGRSPGHGRKAARAGSWSTTPLLSEYAVVVSSTAYSVEASRALVAWEASSATSQTAHRSSSTTSSWRRGEVGPALRLVLLLPHGYEGQGPEALVRPGRAFPAAGCRRQHDSRPADDGAQYSTCCGLRGWRSMRRPLIVMTPKSLLRARQARSPIEKLVEGRFEAVMDDPAVEGGVGRAAAFAASCSAAAKSATRRCHGGRSSGRRRIGQHRPGGTAPSVPEGELATTVDRYPALSEVVWCRRSREHGRVDLRARPPPPPPSERRPSST